MIQLDRLSQIIPPDVALANKALAVSLEQITGAQKLSTPAFAAVVASVNTCKDLPLITALPVPVPASVASYYTNTTLLGSGTCGTVKLVDVIGTLIGWNIIDNLNTTTATINQMDTSALTSCYQNMATCLAGGFTTQEVNPSPPPDYLYTVTIPGLGSWGPYESELQAINEAFSAGLIPQANSIIAGYQSSQSTNATKLNTAWTAMAQQSQREINNQAQAQLNYSILTANDKNSVRALINSLPGYGLQTEAGGPCSVMEQICNLTTQPGQAVVAVMRQGKNQDVLGNAGIGTNSNMPQTQNPPPAQATLIPSTYTEAQASALVVR